jgi:hypothetical protein
MRWPCSVTVGVLATLLLCHAWRVAGAQLCSEYGAGWARCHGVCAVSDCADTGAGCTQPGSWYGYDTSRASGTVMGGCTDDPADRCGKYGVGWALCDGACALVPRCIASGGVANLCAQYGEGWELCRGACISEKDAKLAQKLGQLQRPSIAVFPQECIHVQANLHLLDQPNTFSL